MTNMNEDKFREILAEELKAQRDDMFSTLGKAIGYNLNDEEEVKNIRKDFWMVRSTRLRSERFKATGEKIFFVFFWGALGTAFLAGAFELFKGKLGIK